MKTSKLLKFLLMSALPCFVTEEGGGIPTNEETGEALGTNNNARVSALDRIADNADREREDQFEGIVDLEKGITEKFVAPAAEDAEAEQLRVDAESEQARAAAEAAEREEAEASGQTPSVPTIKVNGVDVQLTPELLDKAQKIASADVYLSEAARKKNEVAAAQTAPAAPAQEVDLRALARDLQMGTEEEAVAALQKLQKAGPSKDDIARTIDDRLSFTTAIDKFQSEYKDVLDDPILRELAESADKRLLSQGDTRPYYERFKAIGDDLRTWKAKLGTPVSGDVKEVTTDPSKAARKAVATKTLPVASVKTGSSVQEEKEESTQEVIARMAAARGGPQWMNGSPKS